MVLKIVAVIIMAFLVYILFFKRNREREMFAKKNEKITDEMVECPTCKTYVSQKEAIVSNGKFYCSQECLENK
ncbi:MAG: PP0621 family protein [Aliarcobacter sp.]|nr:PP0621 family protein [Aliarcobacter sp.]